MSCKSVLNELWDYPIRIDLVNIENIKKLGAAWEKVFIVFKNNEPWDYFGHNVNDNDDRRIKELFNRPLTTVTVYKNSAERYFKSGKLIKTYYIENVL